MSVCHRIHLAVTVAALAVGSLLLCAWVAEASIGAFPPVLRGLAAAAILAIASAAAAMSWRQSAASRRETERYIDVLCRIDGAGGGIAHQLESAPAMPPEHPWFGTFSRVRNCIAAYNERLQEAEHARARAEVRARRLAAEKDQLAEALETLQEPVMILNAYGEVTLANPSAEEMFGFHLSDTERRAFDQLVHCEKLLELVQGSLGRKATGQRTAELLLEHHQSPTWYQASVYAPAGDKGHDRAAQQQTMLVLRDINQQKVIQKRNAEFVAAVSHEMKTPLSGIKAYVELLADGDAEDEATREEFLGVINGQADRLQRLIDNLLNIARIEAGVVQVQKQERPLNEILEEAVSVLQHSAERKHIKLLSDLSGMYLAVFADRDMLLQAAINLLSNAIKYTPEGGAVTIRSRLNDDSVEFEVEDTGVGLSPEDCRRVFEKFYRVAAHKEMAAGTGLGLPLAKHIVEDVHGGQLVVESVLGAGSTFRIALPSVKNLVSRGGPVGSKTPVEAGA